MDATPERLGKARFTLDRRVALRQNPAMATRSSLGSIFRRAGPPALALIVMAFFGGYAVLGANGILAYGEYKHQLERRQQVLERLDRKRAVMRNRVDLVDPRHANPDMVEEQMRRKLNVVHPDDVIVPLR